MNAEHLQCGYYTSFRSDGVLVVPKQVAFSAERFAIMRMGLCTDSDLKCHLNFMIVSSRMYFFVLITTNINNAMQVALCIS